MKKRLLAGFLAAAMLGSLFSIPALAADGVADVTISTLQELKAFRDGVNGGDTYEGRIVMLAADIDLGCNAENQWAPIGNSLNQFKGTFDGGSHKITGLYIDNEKFMQGFFGYVSNDGKVKNLGIHGTVAGDTYVGGVVGQNGGTVQNCYNMGTVAGDTFVGGVVGQNNGTMQNCYNTGTVTGNQNVGGVAGWNGGTVQNCYSTGAVAGSTFVGGVAGWNGGTVQNCYSTGAVAGNTFAGGVAGLNEHGTNTNCYYLSGTAAGGGNGSDKEGAAESRTAAEFETQESFSGWDFDTVWTIDTALRRPILRTVPEPAPPAPATHTVAFNSQGGSGVNSATATHGEKVTKPADPTRSGYSFSGWYKESGCTTAWNFDTETVTGDMTLYAKWTQNSGGGGGYTPPTYPPVVEQPGEGGSVAVSPSRPERGDTVTIKPKPDAGYEVEQVTVTGKSGKPVEVTVKPDGTYTFTQPNGKVKIEVTYKPVKAPWSNPFTDVPEDAWYYDAVRFVCENGLMGGYGNGLFGPNDNLSRAQLVHILFNKEGRPVVNYLLQYGDLATGTWYTEAVRWATSQGIVGGYGNGKFGPDDDITREQLAVMLWRYTGSPAATDKELHFADADKASGFAQEALRWAVEKGIINGKGNGVLDPTGKATRAEAAQMLKNFLESK